MYLLGLLWVPDFLLWILLLVVALYIYGTWPYSTLAAHGYKGPKTKPFIGNIDLIMSGGHFGWWDPIGRDLYGKIFAMYEGRQPTLVVFDTDILKQVMVKEFASFSDRRIMNLRGKVISHSMLDERGDAWRRIRNLTSPFFTSGKLKRNMEHLDHCAKTLAARCETLAEKKESVDMKEITGAFTLEAICLTAFGLQVDAQNQPDHFLLVTVKKMMEINLKFWAFQVGFVFPQLLPLFDKIGIEMWPPNSVKMLQQFTEKAIEERRKSQKDRPDFIQTMMKAHEELDEDGATTSKGKGLTDVEIVAQAALFILAGYDTTSTSLSFLLFNLAHHPECQERLRAEIRDVLGDGDVTYEQLRKMQYLDMCMDESLRLYAPAFRTDRMCTKDVTINGHFIPKGTLVVIPVFALHRDPDLWPEPEKYDPERFSPENKQTMDPYAYQAFGAGPRNCVGMRLAQMELKMAVIRLLQKFELKVADKMQMPVELTDYFFPQVKGGIHLDFIKREL